MPAFAAHCLAADHRFVLTALGSRRRHCGRTEFCDFLVCPELTSGRGVCSWAGFNRSFERTPARVGELYRPALRRTAFVVSARFLSGGIDNHAVVDPSNLKLKISHRGPSLSRWKARLAADRSLQRSFAKVESVRPGSGVRP